MDHIEKFPLVTEELVSALENVFPDKCPDLGFTDRMIWYRAGQASVAEYLRGIHEEQMNPNN